VARALAVFGMIIVNFKIVFGDDGNEWIKKIAGVFDGKAAATFVVLAGVGIALMTKSALENHDLEKMKKAQSRLAKRAVFLFIAGLSYIVIWPADILHFYGIYMLVAIFLLKRSQKIILFSAILMVLIYPFLMIVLNYETGWDFSTLDYQDFWTIQGFFRNLFYNGFHPVIPWTAFMLVGLWFGRQNLNDDKFLKKAFWTSLSVFVLLQILSSVSILMLSNGNQEAIQDLQIILGTSPMPPLPIYMITGSSIAICVISACILICKKYENNKIIEALNKTGQLALTFYVAHVIIGMGIIEIINPSKMGNYSIEFSITYALIFSLLCIGFAVLWTRYNKSGPLEWTMRKLSD
jgi:uncharacterized protein